MLEELLRLLPAVNLLGRELQPSDFRMLVFALVLILTMIFRPQGIFGHREMGWAIFSRFRQRIARHSEGELPAEPKR